MSLKVKVKYIGYPAGDLNEFVKHSEEEPTWVTADRKILKLSEIADVHLANIIDWLADKKNGFYLNKTIKEWYKIMVQEATRRQSRVNAERLVKDGQTRLSKLDADLLLWERKANEVAKNYEATLDARRELSRSIEQTKREWGF